jgi:hypothetical protein
MQSAYTPVVTITEKKYYIIIVACIGSLLACSTSTLPDYYYNEIVIHNKTSKPVRNVAIRVPNTNAVFSCGYIAPGSFCSNKFQKRKYLGNPIKISWEFHDNKRTSDEFVLKLPTGLQENVPFRGVLDITPDGRITTYVEQDRH